MERRRGEGVRCEVKGVVEVGEVRGDRNGVGGGRKGVGGEETLR